MTTLIIPDVHQDIKSVKKILAIEDINLIDEVVFLGDWFDSFHEPPKVASFKDTCLFVRDLVWENNKNKKMVFLVGNHDLAYIYNNSLVDIIVSIPALHTGVLGLQKVRFLLSVKYFMIKVLKMIGLLKILK